MSDIITGTKYATLPLREAAGGGVKETKVRGNVIPVATVAYCKLLEGYKSTSYVQRNETLCYYNDSAKLRKFLKPREKKTRFLFRGAEIKARPKLSGMTKYFGRSKNST